MDRMDPAATPLGGAEQTVVCPNCGNRQGVSGVEMRCDRCGTLLDVAGGGEGLPEVATAAPSDPEQTRPPMVAGGLGGVNDGTQVTVRPSAAVPGKPMTPIADGPAGGSA